MTIDITPPPALSPVTQVQRLEASANFMAARMHAAESRVRELEDLLLEERAARRVAEEQARLERARAERAEESARLLRETPTLTLPAVPAEAPKPRGRRGRRH